MILNETDFPGLYEIELQKHSDDRGYFARKFCVETLEKHEINFELKQANQNHNIAKGTLRGLHYQLGEWSEAKLVYCIKGRLQDVVVDLRLKSPTYKKSFSTILSSKLGNGLLIPRGFAHGYLSLEEDTSAFYLSDNFFEPTSECGIRFNDPIISGVWQEKIQNVSKKDENWADYNG